MADTSVEGELEFHFEKSHLFRIIHVDGAIGAISPGSRLIHLSVFNERTPVPKKIVHSIAGGNVGGPLTLGPEVIEKREVRDEVFREVEADLVFSVDTAVALRAWLDEKIQESQRCLRLHVIRAADNGYA